MRACNAQARRPTDDGWAAQPRLLSSRLDAPLSLALLPATLPLGAIAAAAAALGAPSPSPPEWVAALDRSLGELAALGEELLGVSGRGAGGAADEAAAAPLSSRRPGTLAVAPPPASARPRARFSGGLEANAAGGEAEALAGRAAALTAALAALRASGGGGGGGGGSLAALRARAAADALRAAVARSADGALSATTPGAWAASLERVRALLAEADGVV